MLHEITRVLSPDGILVISSPNRETYSGQPQSHNPYHIKELSWDELNDLLTQHFRFIEFYGQRLATGSFIYPLHDVRAGDNYRSYTSSGESAVQRVPALRSPVYFLAVCSNENKAAERSDLSSIYVDREVDLFQEHVQVSKWANDLHKELTEVTVKLSEITTSFAWQQVCRLRRLRDRVLPVGTKRHRFYVRCLRWARGLSLGRSDSGNLPNWIRIAQSLLRFDYVREVFRVLGTEGIDGLVHRARRRIGRVWEPYRRKYRRKYVIQTSWEPLSFDAGAAPHVSIVIPVYNKHLYTFTCLKSILNSRPARSYEVIVVDDCSTDDTAVMLQAMQGIQVVRPEHNQGFIKGCNQGAAIARGKYVLFLNNDTIVEGHWLDSLVNTFEQIPSAGLIGAKLLYPNGQLQEAGGIIWNDGSGWNYGRCDDPDKPEYSYLREVDYCSGACIVVPRKLFLDVGGFDERYVPAYGEDSDLAFKVREAGRKVYYQPECQVVHFEGVSSGTDPSKGVKGYQQINKEKFFEKWAHVLVQHAAPGEMPHLEKDRQTSRRILVVDACTPTWDQDAGSLKIDNFMKILQSLGAQVTFAPDNLTFIDRYTQHLQTRGVECLSWPYVRSLEEHLKHSGARYDVILSCRPDVTERHLKSYRKYCPSAKVLYDTADLHFLREQRQGLIEGSALLAARAEKRKIQELSLVSGVDCTLVVSELEKQILQKEVPDAQIAVISAVHDIYPRLKGFGETQDFLFLGGYQHQPNVDAVRYFVTDIYPILRQMLPGVRFYIVGSRPPESVRRLACDDVIVTGHVPDLGPYMSQCRLAVNPLRYGAGIKGKIVSCMAYGLPCVGTTLAFEGMGLRDGTEVLIADTPENFAKAVVRLYNDEQLWGTLSASGYSIVQRQYSFEAGRKGFEQVFTDSGSKPQTRRLPSTYYGTCNICGARTRFKTFGSDNLRESLFCEGCGSSCRNRALAAALLSAVGDVQTVVELAALKVGPRIFDTDSTSAIFELLKSAEFYSSSMYRPERPFGQLIKPKIVNVDLQAMPFPSSSYDVVLTSDVMEHVRRDDAAHREIYRCLKPGGHYLFTVPYQPQWGANQIRVDGSGAEDVYLMEKQYHGDPMNGRILVYRIYGRELLAQLRRIGFDVRFVNTPEPQLGILTKDVFVCTKL
jgi:GT2 family glycosyltransferase/SAM-dependent methyltransferase/glycosyltransferase involved in cell wall biosynthesis